MEILKMIKPNDLTKPIIDYLNRNEVGDAEMLADLFFPTLAYDHSSNKWYIFKKHFWEEDRKGEVFEAVTHTANEYLKAANLISDRESPQYKQLISRHWSLLTKQRIKNVLELASRVPPIALTGDEWNIPPLLLPVTNGIIDLTTGTLGNGTTSDYINAYCPTNFLGLNHPAPVWEKFISDICGDDREMISFLQRLLGYTITGDTREQIMPIFQGEGSNGKSTLMDTLSKVLGNAFSFSTQADSLMDTRMSNGEGAKPFVCALRNQRLVWASESQKGQSLNIGLIKQLTGDQNITARNLYGKPFTFTPSHKIFMITNSLPSLSNGNDLALQRRILVLEFITSFVKDPVNPSQRKLDKEIIGKLYKELSGILAWLVRGAFAWQKDGLNPPEACKLSTANYHRNEDIAGIYISENLVISKTFEVLFSEVFEDFSQWCENNGYAPVSNKLFGQRMTQLFGASKTKSINGKSCKVYTGVELGSRN